MEQRHYSTSFYVEALLLILTFLAVLLTLSRVFSVSRRDTQEARDLTRAVLLAQNAAETVSSAHSREELLSLLDAADNARAREGGAEARYSLALQPDAAGEYLVEVTWEPEADSLPTLVESRIRVLRDGESLYSLDTAVYVQPEEGGEAP